MFRLFPLTYYQYSEVDYNSPTSIRRGIIIHLPTSGVELQVTYFISHLPTIIGLLFGGISHFFQSSAIFFGILRLGSYQSWG